MTINEQGRIRMVVNRIVRVVMPAATAQGFGSSVLQRFLHASWAGPITVNPYALLTLGGQPVAKAFDPDKDIGFYDGEAWFTLLRKGMFAILFPEDAHLPGRYTDKPKAVKKIVLKVSVSS